MTKRNLILAENFFNSLFNESPLKELQSYLNGLDYSSVSNFPPSNVYLKYTGEEKNEEQSKNIQDYEWHLEVALTGFNKDEISVSLNEDLRQISIEAKKETENSLHSDPKYKILHNKLSYRSVKSIYSIPFQKIKDYSASYENGLLKIVVKPEKLDNIKKVEIN